MFHDLKKESKQNIWGFIWQWSTTWEEKVSLEVSWLKTSYLSSMNTAAYYNAMDDIPAHILPAPFIIHSIFGWNAVALSNSIINGPILSESMR